MKKLGLARLIVVLGALWMLPLMAMAQGGCVDSPENPTMVLGLVGSTAAVVSLVRQRFTRKR